MEEKKKKISIVLVRETDERDFLKLKSLLEKDGYTKKIKNVDVFMIAVRHMIKSLE